MRDVDPGSYGFFGGLRLKDGHQNIEHPNGLVTAKNCLMFF